MNDDNRFRGESARSAVNLMKAGALCAGISLIFGGVILSGVGLICVLVGNARLKKAQGIPGVVPNEVQNADKFVRVCFGVVLIALVLNSIALYLRWPLIMYVMQTGDLSVIYPMAGSLGGSATGSSTWG